MRIELHDRASQAANKKKVGKDDWERKLSAVELRKEDLNQLVMNFLVTEVRPRPAWTPSSPAQASCGMNGSSVTLVRLRQLVVRTTPDS